MIVGRQFRGSRQKVLVPNCSILIPQRYKKDYEERMASSQEKSRRAPEKLFKPIGPGGSVSFRHSLEDYDRNLKRRSRSVYAVRQGSQSRYTEADQIRERSFEIQRSQERSGNILNRVQRFVNEFESHHHEAENYHKMRNMRIQHRQRESEIKHVQKMKKHQVEKQRQKQHVLRDKQSLRRR